MLKTFIDVGLFIFYHNYGALIGFFNDDFFIVSEF